MTKEYQLKEYQLKEYQNIEEAMKKAIEIGMPVIYRPDTGMNDFYLITGEKIDVEENSELAKILDANKKVLIKVPTWLASGLEDSNLK